MTVLVQPRVLGRYLVYASIASGGMATVYLGRMAGPKGFSRIIAIKQLHAQFVHDTDFVNMFLDEAHLIGRIHHSNVVAPIDVVEADGDLCIIMEYVHGEALGRLMRLSRQERMPLRVVTAIMVQTLLGLHAAHEVTDGEGKPLSIVHRDVSPQNILVGEDGITRVVDFGIAKAAHLARPSDTGKLKGKLGYMAPEQFLGGDVDRRIDIFSAGIILWEMLTGKKLFGPADPAEAIERMKQFEPRAPSTVIESITSEVDQITLKALAANPQDRFATAYDMARALEAACPPASAIEVAEWAKPLVGDTLSVRATWIQELISLDLSEWTQTYVMTSSAPPPPGPASSALSSTSQSVPPDTIRSGNVGKISLKHPPLPSFESAQPAPPRLRLGAWFVLAFAVVILAFAIWPLRHVRANRSETKVFAASPLEQPANAPSPLFVNVSPPAVSTPLPSPSVAPPSTLPSSLPSPSRSVAPPSTQPLPSPKVVPVASSRANSNRAHPDCRVPYVVDVKGIKRFRPECFQ